MGIFKHKVQVKLTISLTDHDIEDLVVTALEGGIGYWACLDNRSETFMTAPKDEPVAITASKILLGGGGITLLDDEDHEVEWVLTLDKLLHGIKKFLSEFGSGANCLYTEYGLTMIDMGEVDSLAADAIVQYALFDEVIYG